jgi:predicted ester cyclase
MAQHGQVLRLKARRSDGKALWAYRYRLNGRRSKRPQVGGFATRAQAERALRRAIARLRPGAEMTLADLVEEYLAVADNYVRHDLRAAQAAPGPEGQKRITADFRAAFPDLRFEVEIMLAEDEFVVARWTATGTHSGRWGTIEPTGRRGTFSGVNIFRFEDGKVAEIWNHRDDLGLLEQLGAPIYAAATPQD